MVSCAPRDAKQTANIKRMHEAMSEILDSKNGVMGLEKVTMPMDEAQIPWLLQESSQYNVLSHGSSDEVEVMLVSRMNVQTTVLLECRSLVADHK